MTKWIVGVAIVCLLAGFLAFQATRPTVRSDLDKMCEIAAKHEGERDPAKRAVLVARDLDDHLRHREVIELFSAMAGMDPTKKASLMRRGVADLGETWDCAAWDRMMGPNPR